MHCCSPITCSTGRFFSRFARRYRRRYQRKGLERSQTELLRGILATGVDGATLLEIGCGVGYLHQRLLQSGAARAVGIDLAPAMLDEARLLAHEQGLGARTAYLLGDFIDLAPQLDTADVTLLDKVVCCYPDAAALVNRSLDKTRRVYALTLPRAHLFNRIGVVLLSAVLKLVGSAYRPYVHDPAQIEAWIAARGFRKSFETQTLLWLTQVYVRP